jgi:hypothetical protein
MLVCWLSANKVDYFIDNEQSALEGNANKD